MPRLATSSSAVRKRKAAAKRKKEREAEERELEAMKEMEGSDSWGGLFSQLKKANETAEPLSRAELIAAARKAKRKAQMDRYRCAAGDEHVGSEGAKYDGRALFCLGTKNWLRQRMIRLIEYPWFDRVVLLLILVNSVMMAMRDPLATTTPEWSTNAEWAFTVLFSVEMACKVVAVGLTPFETRSSYLTVPWNLLDGATVAISWISLVLPDAGNMSSLRSVRVLRPLRTISRIKGMRMLVGALLSSIPSMRDVFALFCFFLLAFGVVGVELFMGRLHYRCYDAALGLAGPAGDVCTCPNVTRVAELRQGRGGCSSYCSASEVCIYTEENPNDGAGGFDHIFVGVTNIFQSVTLEGWSDLM